MADEAQTSPAPEPQDSQGELSVAETGAGESSPDFETRFKDTQASFTKSQQELKATQSELNAAKQAQTDYEAKLAEYDNQMQSVKEQQERIAQAFTPQQQQAAPAIDPAQQAELERLLEGSPRFQELTAMKAQFEAQQRTTVEQKQAAQRAAIDEAGFEFEKEFGLVTTDDSGNMVDSGNNKFKEFLINKPYFLQGLQLSTSKEEAKEVLKQAYYAQQYPNLQQNSEALGIKAVEKKLDGQEALTSVQRPSSSAGSEPKSLDVKPGERFDSIWGRAQAMAEDELS